MLPTPPSGKIEHDFRMTPTRISAKHDGFNYVLYEKRPDHEYPDVLYHSRKWEDVYEWGERVVRELQNMEAV